MSVIGYKIAKNGTNRVIVTLEIPEDAKTNMNRSSIAVKETAKYRANKAKVLTIEDDSGISYTTATSFEYDKESHTYNVGETIEESSYDPDPEKVDGEGIYYFLTRRVAELYGLIELENGLYEAWYDNGQKCEEVNYVDNEYNGLYRTWHSNGQKEAEIKYVNGKEEGLSEFWYDNGQKCKEIWCDDDGKLTFFKSWYENGQKYAEATRVDYKLHGLYQSWHENGQKYKEINYEDGNFHGLYQEWNENGTLVKEVNYFNGFIV